MSDRRSTDCRLQAAPFDKDNAEWRDVGWNVDEGFRYDDDDDLLAGPHGLEEPGRELIDECQSR